MDKEIEAVLRKKKYHVIQVPKERMIIQKKWIYQTKRLSNKAVKLHKRRGVPQGFSQIPGVDINKCGISSPIFGYK